MKYFVMIFLLLVSPKVLAQASCANMQLQVNQTAFDLSTNQTVNPTLVVKANTNPGGCEFFLTFDYGQGTSFSSRSLRSGSNVWPFQISRDSSGTQIIKRVNDVASMNDVISGTLTAGSNDRQVNVSYWAALNMANPWRPRGDYEDNFRVSLYRGSPFGGYAFITSSSVRFYYRAGSRVDISLVPTGGSFLVSDTTETLNFGILTTGASKTCDAVIKYNGGFILKASSQNNGRLKHQTLNEYIDYSASFEGITYALTNSSGNPVQIMRETGESPANGRRLPIGITVGDVSGKRGGQYADTITLTVTSAE